MPAPIRVAPEGPRGMRGRSIAKERIRYELRNKPKNRKQRCWQMVRKYCRRRIKMYKNIFREVFSWRCVVLAFYSLMNKNRVLPLAKRVTWRHLSLEPLCCLSSMPIRDGCATAACCQLLAIIAVTCSACLKIWASVQNPFAETLTHPRTFNDITNHPAGYCALVLFNIFWLSTVVMLALGVKNFNPHLMRVHIAFQIISVVVCLIVASCMVGQLVIGVTDNRLNGPTEEIVTLTSCVLVIFIQLWSVSVVYECVEYFHLCQVLINLAKGRKLDNGNRDGIATVSERIDIK